jgi:hypothetical protein
MSANQFTTAEPVGRRDVRSLGLSPFDGTAGVAQSGNYTREGPLSLLKLRYTVA